MNKYILTSALIAASSIAWNAQSATVINPVDISLTGADAFFPVINLVNGSGLDAQLNTGDPLPATWNHMFGAPDQDSWVSGAFGFPSDWYADSGGAIPTFIIDLGQDYSLNSVHLWAYGGGTGVDGTYQGNTAKTIEFRFSTDAAGNGGFSGAGVVVNLDHGPIRGTPNGFILPRQDFDVGDQTARYVEMRITDNWYVAPGDGTGTDEHGHLIAGGDRVGLGEVRFSAVPEPSAYALLGTGLALVLARSLRRRNS